MNMTQTTALLDQLLEGRELSEVLTDYQALTANHTTPLGLNQWQLSDKPTMAQFNSDNEIIDGKLRELDSALAKKVNFATPYNLTLTPVQGISSFVTGYAVCNRIGNQVSIYFRLDNIVLDGSSNAVRIGGIPTPGISPAVIYRGTAQDNYNMYSVSVRGQDGVFMYFHKIMNSSPSLALFVGSSTFAGAIMGVITYVTSDPMPT